MKQRDNVWSCGFFLFLVVEKRRLRYNVPRGSFILLLLFLYPRTSYETLLLFVYQIANERGPWPKEKERFEQCFAQSFNLFNKAYWCEWSFWRNRCTLKESTRKVDGGCCQGKILPVRHFWYEKVYFLNGSNIESLERTHEILWNSSFRFENTSKNVSDNRFHSCPKRCYSVLLFRWLKRDSLKRDDYDMVNFYQKHCSFWIHGSYWYILYIHLTSFQKKKKKLIKGTISYS